MTRSLLLYPLLTLAVAIYAVQFVPALIVMALS